MTLCIFSLVGSAPAWAGLAEIDVQQAVKLQQKSPRLSSRKVQTTRPQPPRSLGSIGLNALQPYVGQAEKLLDLDIKRPSKKGKQFAQGFIEGVRSRAKPRYKKRGSGTSIGFLKPYLSRSGSAKGFVKLLVLSYAFGDFLADLPKEQRPQDIKKIGASWKNLSFQEKGKKIGRFIAEHYSS